MKKTGRKPIGRRTGTSRRWREAGRALLFLLGFFLLYGTCGAWERESITLLQGTVQAGLSLGLLCFAARKRKKPAGKAILSLADYRRDEAVLLRAKF